MKYFHNISASVVSCILFFVFLLSIARPSHAQWAATYGGGGADTAESIRQTSDGGYIVAGQTLSFGVGSYDVWVLKLDANGTVKWQKTYGGYDWDEAYSIQQTDDDGDGDADDGYIVAGRTEFGFQALEEYFWVLKLDSSGIIQWQKAYVLTQFLRWNSAYSIQQTSDLGYIVAGDIQYPSTLSSQDLWVLKLNSSGAIQWQKDYGGPGALAHSIQQTSDGGFIVAGYTHTGPPENQTQDVWVLKLDSNGIIQWQRAYGGAGMDLALSIQQTSDLGYIVAGSTRSFGTGFWDVWVLKLDSSGTIQWQKAYDTGGHTDIAYSTQQTSDGGFIVAGQSDNGGLGYLDFWVLKLDPSGTVQWQKRYGGGGSSTDRAHSTQQTSDGGFIVAGHTNSSFSAGTTDFLVLKLKADGTMGPECDFFGWVPPFSVVDTNATVTDTLAFPEDIILTLQDTSATIFDTNVSANIICQGAAEEDCGNGSDDDGDGLADCNDPECCEDPSCLGTSPCPVLSETILSQQAVMNGADVSGDYTSTLDFTSLEFVTITTGAFAGRGFSKGECETTLDGTTYKGTWKGALFLKSQERRIYLKGAISGEITATVEGYLTESVPESGVYDQYQAIWQIGSLLGSAVSATINVNGTVSYQSSTEYNGTNLYFLQVNINTIDSGNYGDNVRAVITHLRVVNQGNPHYGEGFSTISYNADSGQGEGWTCDTLISTGIVQMKGLFSSPLFGIATATLDETKLPRTLSLSIERIDLALPPMADLGVNVWGPVMVSPGQTVNYIIVYRNDGASVAEDVVVAGELPSMAYYLSSSDGGMYRWDKHEALWKLGTVLPKESGVLYIKVYFPWGLALHTPQRTFLKYGTSSVDKDYYLNPDWQPLFDLQEYLDYQPQQLEPKDIITAAEFEAELSDANFNDLYQYAIELGYTELVFPAKKVLDGGTTFTSAIMLDPTTDEILFLSRKNDTSTLGQYTETGMTIFDRNGGATYNFVDSSIELWGNWLQTVSPLKPMRSANSAKCSGDDCYDTCRIMQWRYWEGFKEQFCYSGKCKPGVSGGWGTCMPYCYGPYAGTNIFYETLRYCTEACKEPSSVSCEYDIEKCGSSFSNFNVPIGSPSAIYVKRCNNDGCYWPWQLKDDCSLLDIPAPPNSPCGSFMKKGYCWEYDSRGGGVTMAAYCVQADMLCGKHSRCNIHPSEICLPHDPNIKYGPAGPVAAGQQLDYKVEFENEGDGIAFGVYFTDVLDEDLDDSTLVIGPVKNVADDTEIAPAGTYDPATRTITWFVGEVGPHEGGYTELSVNVKGDAPRGTEIINFGTVYFPSVSETTRTNAIVSIIPIEVCNDDIDNDEDALIDCEDLDCFGPDCLEICGDGMDNDGDGWVDCTDPDSTCPPCPEECTNEIDDDEDGLVDCEDSDCEEDDACDTESPVLSIEDGCGISGGCADVSIRLENVPGTEVFSITCDIGYEIDDLSPRDCLLGPAGEDAGKYISVCDYSVPGLVILEVNSSGGVIGDGIVAYVDAKILASCGSETALTLDCTAKDPFNQDVSVVSEGGVLEVVRVGDLDCDGKVMINEVIKVVRMYLGQDPVDPIADPNCDDGIAISEVIKAINCYLETEACPCSP